MSDAGSDSKTDSAEPLDTGHDYDGIHELDNRLPNWWLATLFGAIFFAVGYWFYYHQFENRGLLASLHEDEAEVAKKMAAGAPITDELLVKLAHEPSSMTRAKELFTTTCATCHGTEGEGKIGPNLTDDFWLHGDKPSEVYKTVSGGVPSKGMPAWEPALGHEKATLLSAYVVSLHGKHLPGPRPPEGEKR